MPGVLQEGKPHGMMASLVRKSLRGSFEISTPSIVMDPELSSTMRKRSWAMVDLPAPVLSNKPSQRDFRGWREEYP